MLFRSNKSGIKLKELEETETTSTTFRRRRIAQFDMNQFTRSINMNGITHLAVTFLDYLGKENRDARQLHDLNDRGRSFLDALGTKPSLVSCGFDHKYIIDNRG